MRKTRSLMSISGIKQRGKLALILVFMTACAGLESVATPSLASTSTQVAQPTFTASHTPTLTHTSLPPASQPAPSQTPQATNSETLFPTQVTGRLPDASLYTWHVVSSGLQAPIGLAHAGDGSGRLFVLEQPGRIRIVRDGILSPAPFLDITGRVGSRGFEQGLLGLAFHPNYTQNGFFFVNYTDLNGNTVIARFRVSEADSERADPASELQLLQVNQPYPNHNGGGLAFGPDGYLYIGLGDGGSAGDPYNNAQSLHTLLGKLLRIDVNQGDPYAIPPDNPFAGGTGLPEIWAYGLRNPWRFTFDRLSGDLYIGDVGQSQWEEIDFLPAGSPGGANFGWRFLEGKHAYQGEAPAGLGMIAPVSEYNHDLGCSVTGGVVYRGERLPEWQGIYLYGDYCTKRVWGLSRDHQGNWISSILFDAIGAVTSFGEDEAGEVYLVILSGQLLVLNRQ